MANEESLLRKAEQKVIDALVALRDLFKSKRLSTEWKDCIPHWRSLGTALASVDSLLEHPPRGDGLVAMALRIIQREASQIQLQLEGCKEPDPLAEDRWLHTKLESFVRSCRAMLKNFRDYEQNRLAREGFGLKSPTLPLDAIQSLAEKIVGRARPGHSYQGDWQQVFDGRQLEYIRRIGEQYLDGVQDTLLCPDHSMIEAFGMLPSLDRDLSLPQKVTQCIIELTRDRSHAGIDEDEAEPGVDYLQCFKTLPDRLKAIETETTPERKSTATQQVGYDTKEHIIVALLNVHHRYSEGKQKLNDTPAGVRKLHKASESECGKATVSTGKISRFFADHCGGHGKYVETCEDRDQLWKLLKKLNDDFADRSSRGDLDEWSAAN